MIQDTSGKKGTLWYQHDESCELLINLKRRGELFYMAQWQFMMLRRAMGEKKRNPALVLTKKWWMQQYKTAQDL
eukprot:12905813-Prorocentrum_lima.AAC.1